MLWELKAAPGLWVDQLGVAGKMAFGLRASEYLVNHCTPQSQSPCLVAGGPQEIFVNEWLHQTHAERRTLAVGRESVWME